MVCPGGIGLEDSGELFERAVRMYARQLLATARRILGNRGSAEDVVQQALTNLYEHRARYDWHQPLPVMRRSVVNQALVALRRRRPAEALTDVATTERSSLAEVLHREAVHSVRRAIARLPEPFRQTLILCEYEQMPYAQIADALGASVGQVKTRLHRARRRLKVMLAPLVASDPILS